MCGSGSRNCKTSYRCRLYVIIPSYQASSFATGRGSPYYFRCRPTSTHITKARRPLSLILGWETIIAISRLAISPKALSSFTIHSRLKHCRSSIFFLAEAITTPPNWQVVMNQKPSLDSTNTPKPIGHIASQSRESVLQSAHG